MRFVPAVQPLGLVGGAEGDEGQARVGGLAHGRPTYGQRPVRRVRFTGAMPKAAAVEVEAGGRAVRVSSPDRVIYEATDTHARGHQADGGGVLRVGRGRPDAGAPRAADRAGALDVRRTPRDEAGHLADGPRRRRVLPEAGAEGRARLPRGRGDHLPVGADRRRDLPDRDRGAGVVRAHGDADLPPVAGTPQRRGPPRRAAPRPRPAARARRSPTRCGWPASRASCWRSSGCAATPKTSGNRGIHIFVRIEPRWEFLDVRHAAIGFGRELARRDSGVTVDWWKEERGRADLRRLQPELPRPHHRLGVLAAADRRRARLHAADVGGAGRGHRPARVQPLHRPRAAGGLGRRVGDHRRHGVLPSSRCSRSTTSCRAARCRSRRTTRRCPASRRGCSPARRSRSTGTPTATGSGPRDGAGSEQRRRRRRRRSCSPAWSPCVAIAGAALRHGRAADARRPSAGCSPPVWSSSAAAFVLARLAWRLYRGTPGAWRMARGALARGGPRALPRAGAPAVADAAQFLRRACAGLTCCSAAAARRPRGRARRRPPLTAIDCRRARDCCRGARDAATGESSSQRGP